MILTEHQPMNLPTIPFSSAALVLSGTALVASLGIGSEIGGAVLYGVFLTCLVGATILYTLGIVRRSAGAEPERNDSGHRRTSHLARSWRGLDVDVSLKRQSNTRLLALLSARNPTNRSVVIERIRAADPFGSKVAVSRAEDLEASGVVTVDFEDAVAEIGLQIPPGESRACGFYVLLPGDARASARARFSVELSTGEQRREVVLKRRIPT